jgi:hypothetical protein
VTTEFVQLEIGGCLAGCKEKLGTTRLKTFGKTYIPGGFEFYALSAPSRYSGKSMSHLKPFSYDHCINYPIT